MCKMFNSVDEAQYRWAEAIMEMENDPLNLGLKIRAEFAREDYLHTCAKHGVDPIDGAMRKIWSA